MAVDPDDPRPGVPNRPANGGQTKTPEQVIAADRTLAPKSQGTPTPDGICPAPGDTVGYPIEGKTYDVMGYSSDDPGNDGAY